MTVGTATRNGVIQRGTGGAPTSLGQASATGPSDWHVAKTMAVTMVRRPKSGFLSLWVVFYVPLMLTLQDLPAGAFFDWFMLLCVVVVTGLSPSFVVWPASALRALSCSTAVIRRARFSLGLLFGLVMLLTQSGILLWKVGPRPAEFWVPLVIAALMQIAVYINDWREAEKIEDAVTREERRKHSLEEKRAEKTAQASIGGDHSDKDDESVIGVRAGLGRKLSSGDTLLDEIIVKPWVSAGKWYRAPLIVGSFVLICLTYLITADPREVFSWGQWFLLVVVINAPFILAIAYASQLNHWLAFSGVRPQWWRQHLKLQVVSLWLGPAVTIAAFGGYFAGLGMRSVQPALPWSVYSVAAAGLLGLCGQILLLGLANALTIAVNRMRGWRIGATICLVYAIGGVGIAMVVETVRKQHDAIVQASGESLSLDQVFWALGWRGCLLSLVVAAVFWGIGAWGHKHLNVRDSTDIDFFGTSK